MTADAPAVIPCVPSPLPAKQNIKTEAMGPYHSVDRLPEVCVAAKWLRVEGLETRIAKPLRCKALAPALLRL